jgi:hypothetical protein
VLKHLLLLPVQVLDVLIGLVGKHAAGHVWPDKVFGVCIEEIDNMRANCVRVECSCGFSEAPKTKPTPAAAKVIVVRVRVWWSRLISIAIIETSPPDSTSVHPFAASAASTVALIQSTDNGSDVWTFSQLWVLY